MQRNNPSQYFTPLFSKISTFFFVIFFTLSFIGLIKFNFPLNVALLMVGLGNLGMLFSAHLRTHFEERSLTARKIEAAVSFLVLIYGSLGALAAGNRFELHETTLLIPKLNPFILINLASAIIGVVNCFRLYLNRNINLRINDAERPISLPYTSQIVIESPTITEQFSHPVSLQMSTTLRQQASEELDMYREVRNNMNRTISIETERLIDSTLYLSN